MTHTDEDDEFARIEHEIEMKKGQPYHYAPKYVAFMDTPHKPWVNLTSEEIGEIYRVGWANNMELARAIEAKLKEKNE